MPTAPAGSEVTVEMLTAEHRSITARLRELHNHRSLTSAEKVERSQLKEMKLRCRDRIHSLSS